MRSERLVIWAARLAVGLALLFYSEVVWWASDPLALDALAWATRLVLYTLTAALMLDLMGRFEVGELFGWLVIGGLYGLINGALITGSAFDDLPISLITRPLGLHTLGGGMLALAWLFWLLDGRGITPLRLIVVAGAGLLQGVWVQTYPLLPTNRMAVPALGQVAAVTAVGLILVPGMLWLVVRALRRTTEQPLGPALQLNRIEWGLVGGGLAGLFAARFQADALGTFAGVVLGGLVGYLVLLLFLLRGQARQPVLERLSPVKVPKVGVLAVFAVVHLLALVAGYSLIRDDAAAGMFRVLTAGLTVFGLVWLPGVSVGLGLRSYIRLFRQQG
ncbi:MAG: hypothetical protein Kow0077_09040 [Anaerolineae bacterium]